MINRLRPGLGAALKRERETKPDAEQMPRHLLKADEDYTATYQRY